MNSPNILTAQDYVQEFQLEPHPEGGYFRETYRSEQAVTHPGEKGERSLTTLIYYLLEEEDFSAFHRIKSDEIWHFYKGDALSIYMLSESGELSIKKLGDNLEGESFQVIVPANYWFAAVAENSQHGFSFVGCSVAPGFSFEDFELGERETLIKSFPEQESLIKRLSRCS